MLLQEFLCSSVHTHQLQAAYHNKSTPPVAPSHDRARLSPNFWPSGLQACGPRCSGSVYQRATGPSSRVPWDFIIPPNWSFPFRVSPEKSSKATAPATSYHNAKHRSSHAFIQRENEHAKVAQGAKKETDRMVHDEEREKWTSDHSRTETMVHDQDSQDVNTLNTL